MQLLCRCVVLYSFDTFMCLCAIKNWTLVQNKLYYAIDAYCNEEVVGCVYGGIGCSFANSNQDTMFKNRYHGPLAVDLLFTKY